MSLPTGYCYAALCHTPLMHLEGDALCVSSNVKPNICTNWGLSAEYVAEHSVIANVWHGKYQLLFVSPESLIRNLMCSVIKESLVACFDS